MSIPIHVLTFTANGEGHGLYTEAVELAAIGTLTIQRASTIEFNGTKQQWELRDPGGQLLHTDPSRVACLSWEHQHFNQ